VTPHRLPPHLPCPSSTRPPRGGVRPWAAGRAGRALLLSLAVLLAGCAAWPDERERPFGFDFPPPRPDEGPSAIVFFVDGVNRTVLARMLEAGRLPNLKHYFVDRGLWLQRCVTVIPSVTLACETSSVTGLFPGRHGVTGIKWFDRNRLIWRNYETVAQKNALDGDYIAPTLFERLPDATTMSLFFQAHRGATKFAENWTSAGPPYFFGWYDLVDRLSLLRFEIASAVARRRGAFPTLIIAYMLWPDMEAYRSGVSSEAYERALEHTDAHIGRVLRDLEAAGRLDRTVLVLATDHGMMDVTRHWPIEKVLRDRWRLDVADRHLWEETRFEDRLAYYDRHACVLAGSGDRAWAVYLRKPKPPASEAGDGGRAATERAAGGTAAAPAFEDWLLRPTVEDLRAYPTRDGRRIDLIDRLRRTPAVDVVAYRAGPGRIHVTGRRGTAEIAVSRAWRPPLPGGEGGVSAVSPPGAAPPPGGRPVPPPRPGDLRYAYRVVQGEDPLGYAETLPPKMLLAAPHDAQTWLRATIDTAHPDLVPQLAAYFEAPRSGDLAVFAAPGWDFGETLRGGHGGLRPEEMVTALLVSGPGVPHGRRNEPVRLVDLVPTLLGLLGRPVPTDLDGRNFLEAGE